MINSARSWQGSGEDHTLNNSINPKLLVDTAKQPVVLYEHSCNDLWQKLLHYAENKTRYCFHLHS